jgi:hypothetical protein
MIVKSPDASFVTYTRTAGGGDADAAVDALPDAGGAAADEPEDPVGAGSR